MPRAAVLSPGRGAWRLGPLSIRAYALFVIAGIIAAVVVASRRYRRSGGSRGRAGGILDVAAWAGPVGLAGAVAHASLIGRRHDFTPVHPLWHGAAGRGGAT